MRRMRRSSQLAQLGVARRWSSGVFGQSLLGVSPSVLEQHSWPRLHFLSQKSCLGDLWRAGTRTQTSQQTLLRSEQLTVAFLPRYRLARVLELLPVRRVFEGLVVFDERIFDLALLHEYIAPRFERISPVRPLLIGVLELRRRTIEIPVLGERHAPRVVARRDTRANLHGLFIPRLRYLNHTDGSVRAPPRLGQSLCCSCSHWTASIS